MRYFRSFRALARVLARIGLSAALAMARGFEPRAAAIAARSPDATKAVGFSMTIPMASGADIDPIEKRIDRRKITSVAAVVIC